MLEVELNQLTGIVGSCKSDESVHTDPGCLVSITFYGSLLFPMLPRLRVENDSSRICLDALALTSSNEDLV